MTNGILGGSPAQLAAAGSMDEGWADALAPVADRLATLFTVVAARIGPVEPLGIGEDAGGFLEGDTPGPDVLSIFR